MLDTLPVDAVLHVWEKLREDEGRVRVPEAHADAEGAAIWQA